MDINITDLNEKEHFIALDYFYALPHEAHNRLRKIFETNLETDFKNPYSLDSLFRTSLNRHFLVDIKILEFVLLAENLLKYCIVNNINTVNFEFNKANKMVFKYLETVLSDANISTNLKFHKESEFWVNSLTKEAISKRVLNKSINCFTIVVQFGLLLVNYLSFWKYKINNNNKIIWHSFANNRKDIDYKFLDILVEEMPTIDVLHPNPYLLKSQKNWNKSIYFLGKFSMNPFLYIKFAFQFINFSKKFNLIINSYSKFIKFNPSFWNSTSLSKTFKFFLYNMLSNHLLDKLAKEKNLTIVNVFRGGSAAGLIYSGIAKKKYANENFNSLLVPHATEFSPLDHFSYFSVDYNLLPSENIVRNWEGILKNDYSNIQQHNFCKLVAGGRIDYKLLGSRVKKREREQGKCIVGISLTYMSKTLQSNYIKSVITGLENSFLDIQFSFIIKPRPNIEYVADAFVTQKQNCFVSNDNIYDFLGQIDLLYGTVSSYGGLTMVVLDGIYCDIPGVYLLMNERFNQDNLGYSFHESMKAYTFNIATDMEVFFNNFETFAEAINQIEISNAITKKEIMFFEDPEIVLKKLIKKLI